MFRNLSEPWDFFFQTTHTGVIDVAPDHQTATARWEMREIARIPDGSQSYDNVALYYDRLARTHDGSWRFAERRYYYIWRFERHQRRGGIDLSPDLALVSGPSGNAGLVGT